jgi:hypothetical protein
VRRLVLLTVAAVALAGCGSDDGGASATPSAATATATATPAQAHAKDAHAPPPDSATPTPTTTATATPTSAEDQPGGGGDEQAARVPVQLTVQPDGQIVPATVSVPAFLALELQVRNRTGASLSVTFRGAHPGGPLAVASGATASRRLHGLRKGRYTVSASGAGTATVVVGVEPGP